MATKEDVLQEFKALNITPDSKCLNKCVELCTTYSLSAEEIVEEWSAYSLTHLRGDDPTLDHLEKMERKVFQKAKDITAARKSVNVNEEIHHPPQVNVTATPKGKHVPVSKIHTPVQPKRILEESSISSPGAQSGSYSTRSDARSVRCTYGPTSQFKKEKQIEIRVTPVHEPTLKATDSYMYEILRAKKDVLNEVTESLAEVILKKNKLTPHEDILRNQNNRDVTTYGRIISDCDGKLNCQSVLLEGTKQSNTGHSTILNLSKLPRYSLFPGQAAVVRGMYLNGNKMIVEQIFTDSDLLLPEEPPLTQDSLQMVIACGPFTTQENISFEPLTDLLAYVAEHRPHVFMLLGPFYEITNDGIMNGELSQTFDEFFHQLIINVMETVDSNTHVIIASSQREPHHHPVYPTLPYSVIEQKPNLTLVPDPCLLNINGLVVGATTADVLFHVSNYELHLDVNSATDRLGRIASHLFKQHSFYPLDPPFKDMCIDHVMLEKYGMLDIKPHVMVLPSNFRHFVKNVENCLVVNPERLTKGIGGGTFAHVEVRPGYTQSICERTSCQVIKI